MLQITLLEQSIAEDDPLMKQFVREVVPGMMERYTFMSAKGGRFADKLRAEGVNVERFDRDQSMLAHLLNGIFPAMTLVNLLAKQDVKQFSDIERKVYLAAYCMHDLDKIYDIPYGLDTHNQAAIQKVADMVTEEVKLIGMDSFFPDFADYLDDIVFLIVNTQHQKGTNLNTYSFRCKLKERRLSQLRYLCTYSDLITYLVRSPEHVIHGEGAKSIKRELNRLSQDSLILTYHKLNEVRGLLTNVLNNAVMKMMKERKAIPYLFFPNGVVYLIDRKVNLEVSDEQIAEAVKKELGAICAEKIKRDAPALKFNSQGVMKKPDYYHDFLSTSDYIRMIGDKAVGMTVRDISASPAIKLTEMKNDGLLLAEVDSFEPNLRVGVIARFLLNLWKEVIERLPDKEMQKRIELQILERLEFVDIWPLAQSIPSKGGVGYKWFWLAAQYLDAHRGIDVLQGEGNLKELFSSIIDDILPEVEKPLDKVLVGSYLPHLRKYMTDMLEIHNVTSNDTTPDFIAELEQYTNAKLPKKASLICTVCHSSYPTEEQVDSSVLFQPRVYKNKVTLYANDKAGGICAICSLELMLRQIMLKREMRLTGKKFEELRTKYFYLYPAYFFTPETAAVINFFIDRLQYINLFQVRTQLRDTEMKPADFLNLENFIVNDTDAEELKELEYLKMEYPKNSFPALVFFGMKSSSRDSDTESWVKPAFLALTLPLILNVKTVVSEAPMPLFATGDDFKETVVIDSPHPFLKHIIPNDRLRIYDKHNEHGDDIYRSLQRLAGVYTMSLDTYANGPKPNWNQLNGITRRIATDPMWVFAYLRKQQRGDGGFFPNDVKRYLKLYELLGGRNMSLIKGCVERYLVFYKGESCRRGKYKISSHSITRPVTMIVKAILKSRLEIDPEDLKLEIQGGFRKWLGRVREEKAEGQVKFWGKNIDSLEEPAVEEFVNFFYDDIFVKYHRGERGLLRASSDRFRDGCEAYYIKKRAVDKKERDAAKLAEENQ